MLRPTLSPNTEMSAIMIKYDEQSRTKTPEQQPKKPVPAKDVELGVEELEEKVAPLRI